MSHTSWARLALVIVVGCGGSKLTSDASIAVDSCTDCSIDARVDDAAPSAPLAYFGYWRDALTGSTAEIADHTNISLVDDSAGNILITPIAGVNLCDDCDVGGLSADQWAARKGQIEASQGSYPSAQHFMITLGDGNGDGHLDFQGIAGFTLPAGVDWVGLECYPVLGWSSCAANIQQLKPLMPPSGRFWILVPTETEYGTDSTLVANAHDMYIGAKAEPMVVGMIGFVWTNAILCPPADCAHVLATKQLPALLSEMKCIGQAITRGGNDSC